MGLLKYKGYSGSVEYSPEDNCLFGKVQGMRKASILYEGKSVDEVRKDFEESIDFYLENCKERNIQPEKPFASSTGTTINEFINKAISKELEHEMAL